MRDSLARMLADAGDDLFLAWKQGLENQGIAGDGIGDRACFQRVMDGILALVGHGDGAMHPVDIARIIRDEPSSVAFIVEQARLRQAQGVPFLRFLQSFKILERVAEEYLVGRAVPGQEMLAALLSLRRATDLLEHALIQDWENSSREEQPAPQERMHPGIVLDQIRNEIFYKGIASLIMKIDAQGLITEASPQAARFFSGRRITGRFCGELLDIGVKSMGEILELFPPDEAREIILNRDSIRYVFEVHLLPLNLEGSDAGGSILLLNDITRIADDRLRFEMQAGDPGHEQFNSEKMRSAIFQSVGEGILLVDEDLEVVKANQQACEIYGLSRQNLIGTDLMALTDQAGADKLSEFFGRLIEGQRLSAEMTGLYVDGRTFPTRTTVTRIDYAGKRFWTIIVLDTTEEKALENRLRQEKQQSEEMNLTLKNVLRSIEGDRREFENRISSKIRTAVMPMIEKIRKEAQPSVRSSYLNLLADQLISLTSGFDTELDAGLLKLSRTEIEVCRLIQGGFSSKEIGDAMNLSFETIQTHRKNIRKKLNLNGKNVNLHAYLAGRICEGDNLQDETAGQGMSGWDSQGEDIQGS